MSYMVARYFGSIALNKGKRLLFSMVVFKKR